MKLVCIKCSEIFFHNKKREKCFKCFPKRKGNFSNNLDKFVKLYGEIEGNVRYYNWKNAKRHDDATYKKKYKGNWKSKKDEKMSKSANTLENFIKAMGEERGIIEYYKKLKNSKCNKEGFINRHGEEEGLKRYDSFCRKMSRNLEFFINKHGKNKGLKKYKDMISKGKTNLQGFISRHGESKGLELYKDWYKKTRSKGNNYSKPQIELESYIITNYKDYTIFGQDNPYPIILSNGKTAIPDIYIKELGLIIEMNGDYWHGHPKKFPEEWERFNNTKNRTKLLRELGYTVVNIWVSTFYRKNKEVLKYIDNFLKGRIYD